MLPGPQIRVHAPSGTYFTDALAQNAGLNQRIPLPEAIAAGRTASSIIRGIRVSSFDQNDWEFWFWRNKKFQGPSTGPSVETLAGFWSFAVAGGDGKRIGGTGLYYYYIDGLAIAYEDVDGHDDPAAGCFLNVTLVNRSAGAKTASGAPPTGWFDVTFILEPTGV